MSTGTDMEFNAAGENCKLKNFNYRPHGLVVHPDAPWLGSSPDGLIFDPSAQPPFGLLEIKCLYVRNYVHFRYLQLRMAPCLSVKVTCNDYVDTKLTAASERAWTGVTFMFTR